MANLTKFFEKAKAIYAISKAAGSKGRNAWNEAQRQASAFLKSVKKGEIVFLTDNGEKVTVKITGVIGDFYDSVLLTITDIATNVSYSFMPYQIVL